MAGLPKLASLTTIATGALALVLGGAGLAQAAATESVPARTEVRIVTPFTSTGVLRPGLHPETVSGTCEPASEDSKDPFRTDIYACTFPSGDVCFAGQRPSAPCHGLSCWRDYRSSVLSMVCLFGPLFVPNDSVRVVATNHPKLSKGVSNPLDSEPWNIRFANGEECEANFRGKARASAVPQYTCFGGSGPDAQAFPDPTARTARSKPVWTLKMAPNYKAFLAHDYSLNDPITVVWFAGNNRP